MYDKLKSRMALEIEKWVKYPEMILYVGCDSRGNYFTVACEETKQEIVDRLIENEKFNYENFEKKGYGINDKFDERDYQLLIDEFTIDYYFICGSIEKLKKGVYN